MSKDPQSKNSKNTSWHAEFLARVRKGDTVKIAAETVGVTKENAYLHRYADPEFDAAWTEAAKTGKRAVFVPIDSGCPGWIDDYTLRDASGRLWLSQEGLQAKYPTLNKSSIRRWATGPCRFLFAPSGKLRSVTTIVREPPRPRHYAKLRLYLNVDLAKIAAAQTSEQPEHRNIDGMGWRRFQAESFSDEWGNVWLTGMQALDRFGTEKSSLNWWARKRSRLRAGPALRRKRHPNSVAGKGSPGEIWLWREADIANILAGKESKSVGIGKGAIASEFRQEALVKAKLALYATMSDGKKHRPSDVLERAKSEFAVKGHTVRRAALDVGVLREKEPGKNNNQNLWRLSHAAIQKLQKLAGPENTNRHVPASEASELNASKKRRKPGRPKGALDQETKSRNDAMQKAWDSGRYSTKAAVAREFDVSPALARMVIS